MKLNCQCCGEPMEVDLPNRGGNLTVSHMYCAMLSTPSCTVDTPNRLSSEEYWKLLKEAKKAKDNG